MDLLTRWRPRGPGRRAGAKALVLLAVTVSLALLLAVLSHQAWPPVLVAVLGTLPALYLAWLAVPGVVGPPESGAAGGRARGRTAGRWDPVELGVHRVIGGGPMPGYVRRRHDELLRIVLDPRVPANRLVVVRGGSSTGKTRAAYEAVAGRLADWQVDYPLDAGALAARLEAGIPPQTVLWLGELRQYADADGGAAVLGRLADLLDGEGCLVITTMWPEHWDAYIAAARAGQHAAAGPAGTAGRLLERLPELAGRDPAGIDPARGGVIDVPDRFTAADLDAAASAGDRLVADAAAAAAADGRGGQVAQYLAGVPDLLHRYAGPGGDPYGQAVITAAMDAARLGHAGPLPADLLQQAAVGYLTGAQRAQAAPGWGKGALAWAAAELNGAVRALQPVPPADGTGIAGYLVADYLEQHARRTRQDQLGPPSLWNALTAHATAVSDLTRLGQRARDRGLYRHAAALWTSAASRGGTDAAAKLISHLHRVRPDDTVRAAWWAAGRASLDDPPAVAELLDALQAVGAANVVRFLLDRDPAAHADATSPWSVARLLAALHRAGTDSAVAVLAARTAASANLANPMAAVTLLQALPGGAASMVLPLAVKAAASANLANPLAVARMLQALSDCKAGEAVGILLARDLAAHVNVANPRGIASLLLALEGVRFAWVGVPISAVRFNEVNRYEADASEAIRALANRAANETSVEDPRAVSELLRVLDLSLLRVLDLSWARSWADHASAILRSRAAAHTSLDDPLAVAELLKELRTSRAFDLIPALVARAVGEASLHDPVTLANLLRMLHATGAGGKAAALTRQAVGQVRLEAPQAVADLLDTLRVTGANDAVRTLLARNPAAHVDRGDMRGVSRLLQALNQASAEQGTIRTLAGQAASVIHLEDPLAVAELLDVLRAAGADDAVQILLARNPAAHVDPGNPRNAAELLHALRTVDDAAAVAALAVRAATAADMDDPPAVAALLGTLCGAGLDEAADTLAVRAANAGMFSLYIKARPDQAVRYASGREPDGTACELWSWQPQVP